MSRRLCKIGRVKKGGHILRINALDALPGTVADETLILLKSAAVVKANGWVNKLDNRLEDGCNDVQSSM